LAEPSTGTTAVGATTVREAAFAVMREVGMTTIFSNPGSTEVPFLADLPDDLDFVLALHEASVVGIATGHALATGRPALALVHTTAGLGNAVAAIATARVNRAPVVVMVGQQDRRHLALEPFLAGRLSGLAGDYPVEVIAPVWAGEVPSAIARATHRAQVDQGPVLLIVPMDDWDQPAAPDAVAAPQRLVSAPAGVPAEVHELAGLLSAARSPALVAGAGVDTEAGWDAVRRLARALGARVYAEPFGARAGFDQTDEAYAGQLPADRTRLRDVLTGHDVLLVLGTAALRQYPYEAGALVPDSTRVVVVTADEAEALRSPAMLSVVADPAAVASAVVDRLAEQGRGTGDLSTGRAHTGETGAGLDGTARRQPPAGTRQIPAEASSTGALRPEDVFAVLAEHLPAETVLIEESPSSRPALQAMVPARVPMGFLSAAMGGLGFALPAAVGVKMARPHAPVIAVVGDGSSLYSIQALWTAAHRGVGALFLVLANGRYAVMDRLADRRGGKAPWPAFPEVSVSTLAAGFGVRAVRLQSAGELAATLPHLCAGLAERTEPLVVEVAVEAGTHFQP
jgi:benzoylformate decarboxylase